MITYIATNIVNGRFYVGSTTNFKKRRQEHLKSKLNHPFQCALRKNPENFVWHFAEDGFPEPRFEQVLLDLYFGSELCYNLNPKASRPPSQAGRPVSKETRQKQSVARKGLKRSEKTKKKMSLSKKGKLNPRYGKPSSSPAFRRGVENPLNKKVEVIYPDGAIKVFCSTKEAGKLLGVSGNSVAEAARENKTKTRGNLKGYTFRYL